MTLETYREGDTELLVPAAALDAVPSRGGDVFFNPEMELNRDLTVLAVATHRDDWPDTTYLDAMAGTGARGLRVANEAGGPVVINDRSRDALDLVQRNLEHNDLDAETTRRDANALLSEKGFDVVDIDPFGSPAPFLDSGARSVHMNGMLCATATDTAPLCGAHRNAGIRRYDAHPLNREHNKEVGARILLGFAARTLARYDKALQPLLTVYHRHYFRVFLGVGAGARRSDAALENVGHLLHCEECRESTFTHTVFNDRTCGCGAERTAAGPLWTGDLHDPDFVDSLLRKHGERGTLSPGTGDLLETVKNEVGAPPLYYDFHLTASRSVAAPPKIQDYLRGLRDRGYAATRTHFDPEAVKTDAPPRVQEDVMKDLSPS